jgi:hypothetical protein
MGDRVCTVESKILMVKICHTEYELYKIRKKEKRSKGRKGREKVRNLPFGILLYAAGGRLRLRVAFSVEG